METVKTIRSKTLNLFSAIMIQIYGLIVATVACMYVWQILLAEVLFPIINASIKKIEASDTNLPLNSETVDLKKREVKEDEAS
ncbi:MAG: hypothetical protein V1850_00230 [Candidatus Bathyarchaeota archaeon]